MNENLESARTRYVISEAVEDMNDALKKQDYKTAKVCSDCAYKMLYEIYKQETDAEERDITRKKLEELSDVINEIYIKLNPGVSQ